MKTDKRSRLIQTAVKLAYRHGFRTTSLADIAEAAKVPVGNVYYYFKTKDEIGEAIVEQRLLEFRALQEQWDRGAPRKNAFWRVSRIRLKTGICLHAEGVPSGRFVPSCTRRAGLWRRSYGTLRGTACVDRGSISGDRTRSDLTKTCCPTSFSLQGISVLAHGSGEPELVAIQTKTT